MDTTGHRIMSRDHSLNGWERAEIRKKRDLELALYGPDGRGLKIRIPGHDFDPPPTSEELARWKTE
jgi:hypothetical protein